MDQNERDIAQLTFGFRDLIMMFLLFVVAIVFTTKGYLTGANFTDLMKTTMISFFATKGWEHASLTARQYFNGNSNTPPTPPQGGPSGS